MRLVSFEYHGNPHLGICLGEDVLDLRRAARYLSPAGTAKLPGSMSAYLASSAEARDAILQAVARFCSGTEMERLAWRERCLLIPFSRVPLLPPVPRPGKIICVGMNYPAVGQSVPPEYPPLFLKPASTLIGSGRAVRIPPAALDVAFEAELALVIGRTARHVSQEDTLSFLAGYTLANDLGDRLLERRTSQWTTGKLMDTFCPLGPALVTPDEVPSPENLEIRTWLNSRLVQQGNTRDMFFSPSALISYLSHLTTLEPGDIILTGSPKRLGDQPAPVIALQPGDRVIIEIAGLGRLENLVEAEKDWR